MKKTTVEVSIDDLEKIQKDIDRLKTNKRVEITTKDSKGIYVEYDFTEKEKRIYEYIKNNPGTTKQAVVNNFKGINSRIPILNAIDQLENGRIIIVRKDEHNSQVHRLFINSENILVSLIKELDSFKQPFFKLIDKAMTISKQEGVHDWLARSELVGALLFPYKHFIMKYNLNGLFFPRDTKIDDETLHKKFTIVFDTMQEVHAKLYKVMSDNRWIDNDEESKERLPYSRDLEELNYERLNNTLKILEKYGLRQSAEEVFDSLFGNREWPQLIKSSRSVWLSGVAQIALSSLGKG